ncbi:MAG: EAL domain-containing protein, partial [Pseudomonadota bacterium]
MVHIGASFTTICMALIASLIGVVLYLRFGCTGAESAMVTLAAFAGLALYSTIAARLRDWAEASNRLSILSRGSSDLGRKIAEFGRRRDAMETRMQAVLERSLTSVQPLAAGLEELSTRVRQIGDTVAGLGADAKNPTAPAAAARIVSIEPLGP